ncbi:MAG: class I SAM-dependent methyltransferase [Coriobacteriia bacterium]|nr:class I SAM-dependent methyltransferase [Coriobacteriia bacterium]
MQELTFSHLSNNDGSYKNTWEEDFRYTKSMKIRGLKMLKIASKVCKWKSIVDVGCGNQQLKPLVFRLNPEAEYIGIDRLNHCSDTIIADFNKGEYPKVTADLAILSGVVEYIYPEMIDRFFSWVCDTSPIIVLSYWPIDFGQKEIMKAAKRRRRPDSWVNHFTISEVITIFSRRGFFPEMIHRYQKSSQYIMLFGRIIE